jgi:hypothetical protein
MPARTATLKRGGCDLGAGDTSIRPQNPGSRDIGYLGATIHVRTHSLE